MERKYNNYDCLRYELFEVLIPAMLYQGTEEENNEFFRLLMQEGKTLLYDMYNKLCEEDKLSFSFEKADFGVEVFERGGINILQIKLPPGNPDIADILRAYVLFMKGKDGTYNKKYFVIKRFIDGEIFNLHITPGMEKLLGEELTGNAGDMEYEYWKLVRDYVRAIV